MLTPVQEVEAAPIIMLLTAVLIMAFWRTLVRWLIALASAAIIVTLGFGLIMIWQAIHHMAG